MDLTADPCEDFFQFACGTWNKVHPIPEDHSSISTFEVSGTSLGIQYYIYIIESALPGALGSAAAGAAQRAGGTDR